MSEFMETLKARRLGAEILARLGRERRDGELTWTDGDQQKKILFKGGRPEAVVDRDGRASRNKQEVVAAVRGLATAAAGRVVFEVLDRELPPALGIDTLGETLVALARGLRADQLEAIWAARGAETVRGTASFEKFAAAVAQVGGARVREPAAGVTLGHLVSGCTEGEQRAWVALISLGAVATRRVEMHEASAAALDSGSVTPPAETAPAVAASATNSSGPGPHPRALELPDDLDARGLALEIERMHRRLVELSLYEVLEVDRSANAETIRDAYFEVAKRWHSDRFKGYKIGEVFERKAEEIFRKAGEAQEILSNEEKRRSYDFVEDRKARGLPTDVSVILEAEGLFRKAQALVRRGQAVNAEPILRQAVEMNKGEAEFWAYLGFAVYSARGSEGLKEAQEYLKKSLGMNHELAVAHEFLGRIARVEGRAAEAKRELHLAIELDPKNVDAERELRLLNLRARQPEDKGKGIGGLIGGLFKK